MEGLSRFAGRSCTGLWRRWWLRDHALLVWLGANSTTAGMVFLVLVVWAATQAGLWLSLYIAVLCALSFDYFFLLPYRTLRLAGAQEWVAMLSFVAGCLVVSRVAEQARRQRRRAEHRRKEVERLYELSQELMLYEDAEELIRDLPRLIDRIFSLDGVVLYVCDRDRSYASTSDLPMSIHASLRAMTQGTNPTLVDPRRPRGKAADDWDAAGRSTGLAAGGTVA